MEQHFNSTTNYTLLGSNTKTTINPDEECCWCNKDYNWALQGDGSCTCPSNPTVNFQAVLVTIVGTNIPAPKECTYNITIWTGIETKLNDADPSILWGVDNIQFSISSSIYLDCPYQKEIKQFKLLLSNLEESVYSFKGKTNKNSYIRHFLQLINDIQHATPVNHTNDIVCPHVNKRKKGHSHVK